MDSGLARVLELAEVTCFVTKCTVHGHHVARFYTVHNDARYVTDSGVHGVTGPCVALEDGHRRPTSGTQSGMQALKDLRRAQM